MQPYTVILAGTTKEAVLHAKRHRLPRSRWRYVVAASNIRGLRRADIHVLPGFHKRLDRFGILGELKHTKGEVTEFDEPMTWLGYEDAWVAAHAEALERLDAGRLSLDEALEAAYVTTPVNYDKGGLPPGLTAVVNDTDKPIRVQPPAKRKPRQPAKPASDHLPVTAPLGEFF